MGSFYMEATQINYRRDETLKTVDQKLQELSEESAVDTDIAPLFSKTATYNPGDLVYYKNKLYVCNTQHTGAWAAADFTATTVSGRITASDEVKADNIDLAPAFNSESSYAAGDLVTYNGTVYRCTNDHTGAWDADDFSATTISAELASLKSGLTNVDVALSVPEGTGKNILMNTKIPQSKTSDGVTLTALYDADGYWSGFSFTGTLTKPNYGFEFASYVLKAGTYTINSVLSRTDKKTAFLIYDANMEMIDNINNTSKLTSTFTISQDMTIRCYVFAYDEAGDYSGLIFRPMIRLASVSDSTYAPYIPSVESRIEAVESNLLYLGKGTHDFKKTVYCGYISGSGNYVDFFVPCKYDNTISTVTLNSSALMSIYTFNGTLLTQGYIDFTVVSLEKTIGGLRIELKFSNTQTTYINTIVNIAFGNDSVFTFA